MATPVTNFGKVTVSIGYDASATSIDLSTGHGSRLPSTFPYPLVWWDSTTYSDPADDPNKEIVTVTNRSGDTLTVTRAAEGTSGTNKNTASKTYKMVLAITKGMWDALGQRALSQTFRGLHLQTHTDSDKSLNQVRLVHADAIVMNDGEEVSDWNNIDCDLAGATGIGGLDTGTEQASTWYQLYAMWDGTTKGLMAHRAKDYLLDTQYITGEDASQGLRSAVDNSTVKIAQGLQFATAGPLLFIDVKLAKTGSPTGNFWFTLESNSGGVPSNTPLATSDKLAAARLTTTAQWVRIPFRTPYSVSAATQYHLVMQGDYTVSAANFVLWRMDGSVGSYANGSKALFDSDTSTWTTDTDDDMQFSAYITRNDTALTVPAGYRYALIGWAYNNSGSNLVEFRQQDRNWQLYTMSTDGLLVNETAATATLIDLRAAIPPITCMAWLALTGTGAAAAAAGFGDIKMTDVTAAVAGVFSIATYMAATSEFPSQPVSLSLEYNGLMLNATAGADLYLTGFDW